MSILAMMASREFISGLIELYRNNPCLWKTTCPEYTNKIIKNACYEEIVEYSKKFFKEADKVFVQQKLQNLRTSFRKEVRKIEDSKNSGSDDLYVPKLWYYDLLLFTLDDGPRQTLENRKRSLPSEIDFESDNETEGQESEEYIDYHGNCEKSESQKIEFIDIAHSPVPFVGTSISTKIVNKSTATPKQIQSENRKTIETCSQAINKLSSGSNTSTTQQVIDEYDALGISWAAKLRKLSDVQKVLAEDLIHQALKKAYFEELTRNTVINEQFPQNGIR